MKAIKDILNEFTGKYNSEQAYYSERATVMAVDTEKNTCTVETVEDQSEIVNVQISAYIGATFGLLLIPAVDSIVTISFYSKDEAFISKTSRLESFKIVFEACNITITEDEILFDYDGGATLSFTTDLIAFNGGALEGLVTINELTTKLNALVSEVNTIYTELKAHTHTSAAPGAPTTPPVPPLTSPSPSNFNKGDYENTTVKQ